MPMELLSSFTRDWSEKYGKREGSWIAIVDHAVNAWAEGRGKASGK